MRKEPSILERFKEREEEIKRETAALDKEMNKKRIEYEKKQVDALAKLETARANLARMKAEYKSLEGELEGKAAAEIGSTLATAERVRAGEVSLGEFMRQGLSAEAVRKKAGGETAARLAGAMQLIREKQRAIFELELEEAETRQNVIYCSTYPGQNQIARLKAEISALEQGVSAVLYGYPKAAMDVDRAKTNIGLCDDKSLSGLSFDSLTYEELVDLRFDPRFTERYREQLEGCISSLSPGQRCSLILATKAFGREAGLIFRILDEDRPKRALTTTETKIG